jgi:DNA-binding CsgD family transcriptional regulator
VLDELDYGIVLLSEQMRVVYCNRAARRELDGAWPIRLAGDSLCVAAADESRLYAALRAASQKGLRSMVTLRAADGACAVAVVPMPRCDGPQQASVLLMLGRRQVCEALSAHGFANGLGLTPAEREVLSHLSSQRKPTDIAKALCVALSTVRSHIASIRAKSGAASIRDLVELLARLPPLTGVLR